MYSEPCQTFKMEHFAKRIVLEERRVTRHVQCRESFAELQHFKNVCSKELHNYTTTFWMENLTQRWTKAGPFFPKFSVFFGFL